MRRLDIRFPELELGEANQAARSLREAILNDIDGIDVEIVKDDPTTQDFGATLVLMLGAPAVVVLARGIATWMAGKRKRVEIEVDGQKKVIKVEGDIDVMTARVIEAVAAEPR